MATKADYDEYTLPDGKKVYFPKGTSDDLVMKRLESKYSDSLRYMPPTDDAQKEQKRKLPEDPGFFPRLGTSLQAGFHKGTAQIVPGVEAAIAMATGDKVALDLAVEEMEQASEEASKLNPNPTRWRDVGEAYRNNGVFSAIGEALDFTAGSIGQSVGHMAPSLGLLAASSFAAAAAAPAAAALGVSATGAAAAGAAAAGGGTMLSGLLRGSAFTTRVGQYFAETTERRALNGELEASDADLAKVLSSAIAQGGLETVSWKAFGFLGPGNPIQKAVTKAVSSGSPALRDAANQAAAVTIKEYVETTWKTGAKGFMKATAVEAGTETGQLALERAAAGESITPEEEEDMHEYMENLAGAILGASPFSTFAGYRAYAGPRRAKAEADYEEKMQAAIEEGRVKSKDKVVAAQAKLELKRRKKIGATLAGLYNEASQDAESLRVQAEADSVALQQGIGNMERTLADIKNVALDRGYDIESNRVAETAYNKLVFETIGHHNDTKATAAELDKIYNKISSLPTNEEVGPLPVSKVSESIDIATDLAKIKKPMSKQELRDNVQKYLEDGKKGKGAEGGIHVNNDYMKIRTDSIIAQMLDNGSLLDTDKGFVAETQALEFLSQESVSKAAYRLVDAASRSVRKGKTPSGGEFEIVGEFPNFEQSQSIAGKMERKSYNKIRDALVKRGVIAKRGNKYFYRDIPDVLSNRREYTAEDKPSRRWIVRDLDGNVVHIGRNKGEATSYFQENNDENLQRPAREEGYLVRESEYLEEDGKNPKFLRSRPVEWVPNSKGANNVAIGRAESMSDINNRQRAEYLGTQGEVVKSDLDPVIARKARSENEAHRREAADLLKRSPHEESLVLRRYNYGFTPDNSPTSPDQSVLSIDPDNKYSIPFDALSRKGVWRKILVKMGMLTPEGRGFGKARLDANFPGWEAKLDETMTAINDLGKQAFAKNSKFTAFPDGAGRTIITDGFGDDGTFFVFDYIEDGEIDSKGEPVGKFHLYNMFKGSDIYGEHAEDFGPLDGNPEYRGQGVSAETVRAVSNPEHNSVRRFTDAQRQSASVALNFNQPEAMSIGFTQITLPPRPKTLISFLNDFVERNWGMDNWSERVRIKTVDDKARGVSREALLIDDRTGDVIRPERSSVAAMRLYHQMPHMMFQALNVGHIKLIKPRLATDVDEMGNPLETDAMVPDVVPFALKNTAINEEVYDPDIKDWIKKDYEGSNFTEERKNLTGGLATVWNSLTPERLKKAFMFQRAKRSLRMHREAKAKGEKEHGAPMEMPEIIEAMSLTDGDADIAVAVQRMQELNEHTVQFAVDSGILSSEDAKKWLENSDYISFYLDFEGAGNEQYTKRARMERQKLGILPHFLGDMHYKEPTQKYKGMKKGKDQSIDDFLSEPIDTMLGNQLAILTAGVVNIARTRIIRNELALGAARRWAKRIHGNFSHEVKIRVDGKDVGYEVDDELLFNMIEGEWGNSIMEKLQLNKTARLFTTAPSQILRETVTRNPGFAIPNMIKDATILFMVNGGGFGEVGRAAKITARNVWADARGRRDLITPHAKTLNRLGVTTGIDQSNSVNNAVDMATRVKRKIKTGKEGRGGFVGDLWRAAGRHSAYSESATREIAYEHTYNRAMERLKQQGVYSEEDHAIIAQNEAMYQAREVLNFSTKGNSTILSLLTAMAPFINARIQGMDILARGGFKLRAVGYNDSLTPDQRQKGMLRRGAYVATISAMLQMLLMDNEDYENEAGYKRDDNFFLPIPGYPGKFFTFPAPFELGFIFKTIPEQITRNVLGVLRGDMDRAQRDSFRAFKNFAMNTLGPGQAIPVVLRAPAEWAMNRTIHGDIPIESHWEKNLPANLRYNEKNTAQARLISNIAVGSGVPGLSELSAKRVDAAIRTITGGLGAHLWAALDTILRMPAGYSDDWPVSVKPLPRLSDIAALRRLFAGGGNVGGMQEFYEYREALEQGWAIYNSANTPLEKSKLRYEYRNEILYRKQLGVLDKQMNILRKREDEIRRSDKSAPEKRKAIDKIEEQRASIIGRMRKQRRRYDEAS